MVYDLSSDYQRKALAARLETLMDRCAVVELTEKAYRSKSQNSYLHLLIGVVAMETGSTLEYSKEIYFKRMCNPDLFVVTKQDRIAGEVQVLRSSADLTKEEMYMAIDRFKRWGAENGFYMPSPGDEELLKSIAIEMGRMKNYIG